MAKLIVGSARRTNLRSIVTDKAPMSNQLRIVITSAQNNDKSQRIDKQNPLRQKELSICNHDTNNKTREASSQDKEKQESALEELQRSARKEEYQRYEQDYVQQDEENSRQRTDNDNLWKNTQDQQRKRVDDRIRRKNTNQLFLDDFPEPNPNENRRQDQYTDYRHRERSSSIQSDQGPL